MFVERREVSELLSSSTVELINWMEMEVAKAVTVSMAVPKMSKMVSTALAGLVMLLMSNTFFRISTTVPLIF